MMSDASALSDVGGFCCLWRLSLAALVPLVWAGGTLAMGFASPVGRSWVGIPGHWGVVFVCRNGRFAAVELLGLLLGVSPLGGLDLG